MKGMKNFSFLLCIVNNITKSLFFPLKTIDEVEMRQAVVRSKEDFKNISIPSEFSISLNYNQENRTMSCDGKIQMNPCHMDTFPSGSFLSGVILTRADD